MKHRDTAQFDVRNTYTNSKRAAPLRQTVPQNVVIGIVLGVIAVVACAIIVLLLLRLNRQTRVERRLANQVDLLEPEPYVVGSPSSPNEMGVEKQGLASRWNEKPLPQIPDRVSMRSFTNLPRSTRHLPDRDSIAASRYDHSPVGGRPILRPLLPAVSRQVTTRDVPSNFTIHNSSNAQSMTHSHTRTHSGPPVDSAISHGRLTSTLPSSSESSGVSDAFRGQFAVVNVTETDGQQFQRPQPVHQDPPPPDYIGGRVRGRDAPFPLKKGRKPRPPSIITGISARASDGIPSTASPFSWEKLGFGDAPGTSYTVHVPLAQSAKPVSPFVSHHTRTPLTITSSRPMSNVILEDMGSICRIDGTKGKGHMVTMTVLVEESDGESQDDPSSLHQQSGQTQQETLDEDALDLLVERYAADLPPYTPVHEYCTVP